MGTMKDKSNTENAQPSGPKVKAVMPQFVLIKNNAEPKHLLYYLEKKKVVKGQKSLLVLPSQVVRSSSNGTCLNYNTQQLGQLFEVTSYLSMYLVGSAQPGLSWGSAPPQARLRLLSHA